ncbi:hypothetical protein BSKO_04388 [Bryopsis sp. KO-2023]|nr:hypothetical protein BSKO_04388 [Bryopsis sp. KO-2023]
MAKSSKAGNIELQQEYVLCGPDLNYHTTCEFSAGTFNSSNFDYSWNFQKFKEGFSIVVKDVKDERMEFDMIGADPSLANAFRRIMISEVPTVAIEHVFFINNTSVIADEVLAHRLGLVPIGVDPRLFVTKKDDESASEKNSLVFKLHVACKKSTKQKVVSGDLVWLPMGTEMPTETNCNFMNDQQKHLKLKSVKPFYSDILLAKMRPGQEIQLEAHCCKGIGREHAKWSPVATAWYRLQPEVVLLKDVEGERAKTLAQEFSGLFVTEKKDGKTVAKVTQARGNEKLLEKVRRYSGEDAWKDTLQLRKKKRHIIFTVESVGQYKAKEIFLEAVDILIGKCDKLIESL